MVGDGDCRADPLSFLDDLDLDAVLVPVIDAATAVEALGRSPFPRDPADGHLHRDGLEAPRLVALQDAMVWRVRD